MTGLTNVVSGSLEVAGDDDWVAVALTANETYQFTVTGLTNFASLILYPPGSTGTNQGTVTLFSPGGTSQAATLTVTPTATGTYYLDISDPGYSGSVETYTVTALNLGAPPAHLGDTPGTAGHLTIGGSLTSTLEYGTEHDWIAVALTANQTYEFTISGLDDQAVLMTYAPGSTGPVASANPTNVTVYPGNAQTNYLTLTPTTSGTYYIDISDPTAALSTETYTISGATVTDDFTNNPTHPAQLAVGGTPTYANLEVAGDHDWFAVNLTANQAYEFTEHGLTNYAVLTMYPPGSTGTNQATNAQAYSGGAQDSYLFFTPTTTGRYYLDVSDPGYATASTYYHVSVVTVAPDYTNNPSNAGLLTVGGSTTGTLSVLGEHDWIAVALTADQSYQFTVTGLSDLAVLQTFAPGSLGLNQGSPGISEYGGPQTNYLAFTPTQTGTYYLDISDPGNSGSPETYTVSAAAYSDDDTDNPTRPGHLTVGGSTTGVLETAGDHDWIAVTLTANQTYEFTVNGLTSFASLMTYAPGSTGINEATNAITIDPAYAQLQTAYLTFTPTETGTYYLDVSDAGYSGTPESYTLSVATAADDYTNNPSNPALLQVTVPTLAPAPADFTGDGLSNIVWQNTSGQIAVWTVSGTALSGSILPIATPAWTLQDTGDFNGDGKSGDLLFRDGAGDVAIWTMNGLSLGTAAVVATVPLSWKIEGTGDFNGDGKSDILWDNSVTGQVAIWEMNGVTPTVQSVIATLPAEWKIAGTADFNGDGKSDILWRDANTGQVAIWEMNGTTPIAQTLVSTIPLDWHIVGTGDFNGDGTADLLWQNSDTGQVAIWEMNGAAIQSAQVIATLPTDWHVVGTGDFNGDGKADIVWQNSDTGQTAVWEMNGFTPVSRFFLSTVDHSWKVLDHHFDWV